MTENIENNGCSQRDSAEHEGYAKASRSFNLIWKERDSAKPELLEKILDRNNMNRAFKRVKANNGAAGVDGMTIEEAFDYFRENIEPERLLVVADDLSLPLGQIRIKPKGSDAGHNGLGNIASVLCTQEYARLRFGIGNDFPKGTQVDYVLGRFSPEDDELLKERLDIAAEAIRSLCLSGIARTMNQYNKK